MNQESAPVVKYRCVCGDDVSVNPLSGGKCDQCGRFISKQQLSGDVSQTIVLYDDGSGTSRGSDRATPPADDAPLLGESLEHFKIISRLGYGGMGTVYTALDESLQRYVALKVISNRNAAPDRKDVERLLQEARAQARVNHANVVHIYYVSRCEHETPFLAMELIDGPTLAARMAESPLSYKEVVEIGLQVVEALRQSARYDIVHGDIKPSNILLKDGNVVKLSDFGLSSRISTADQPTGPISGTPNYMAPELFDGVAPNVKTDQYALGVMLFEMTFGRSPYSFESTTVPAVIKAHRQAPIEFPEPWPSSLPIVWRSILERMLSKRPESRFESFEEVGYRLYHARPHDVRKAGRLVRGLAWAVDLTICIAMVGIVIGVVTFGVNAISSTGSALNNMITVPILAACVFALPAGVGYFQARWGTTPGKKLMQIRIVDEHGLRPHRWQLVFRVIPQLLPAWALLVNGMIDLVVPESVSDTLAGVLLVITGADALPALFSKKGRSLHDWFFNTQVVLDDGRGD